MIVIATTIFLFVIYAALIIYYLQSWLQIPVFQLQTSPGSYEQTFITVIIAARNEEKDIKQCIDSILVQSYPKDLFEILVVDDHSTDNTPRVVKSFANQNVFLLSLKDITGDEELNSYKKKAIEVAVNG